MKDDAHSPDEDEAFWEGEGGDRTITSPFDPSAAGLSNVPSPISDPPPAEPALVQPGTLPAAFAPMPAVPPPRTSSTRMPKPELPARAPDDESTRAVSGDAFFAFPDPASLPAAPFDAPRATPRPAPAAAALPEPDHLVFGSDAVGDENTVAVSAPSMATKDIAAALAATLGAGVGAWGAAPEPPSPQAARSPIASTLGGPPGPLGGAVGTPLSVPLVGPGVPGAPFGSRDPASGTMPARPHAPPLGLGLGAPSAAHHHPSSGAMPAGFPPPPSGSAPTWQPAPGYGPGSLAPYPPAHGPQGMHGGMPMAPARPAAPRGSSTLLLALVGVVCLAIFIVGVVLFLRSNS